jgi:hypothetical protein
MIHKVAIGAVSLLLVGFLLYGTIGIALMTLDMPPVSP